MKVILVILLVIAYLPLNSWAEEKYAEKVKWNSLSKGLKRAKIEKKPVLVDFGIVKGCPRCQFLLKNVYSKDAIVKKINSDFIPVFIDLGKDLTPEEKDLGEKYDYKNDCLLLFLDYTGNIIKDKEGKSMCFIDKVEPEVFIKYLEQIKNAIERGRLD